MTAPKFAVYALALLLVTSEAASAQKTKCTDVPISVEVVDIIGSALAGDARGPVYRNGEYGVSNTVIHLCGGFGVVPTYDATMGVVTSRRSLVFYFPPPEAGSLGEGEQPPAWADDSFSAKPFMNIKNILWGRMNPEEAGTGDPERPFEFTTRMVFTYLKGPNESASYKLHFTPETTDAVPPPSGNAWTDAFSAPVRVVDKPGNCRTPGGSTLDEWTVTVDPDYVGSLTRDTSDGPLPAGRYRMPFQLKITALRCF